MNHTGAVRYGILGITTAHRDDGVPVALPGSRLRALLAALALRPGHARSPGALIAEVWADAPPADAPGALQALVGRLRRAVGREAVVSADGGYRLTAGPEDIDLYRFERLAGEGGRALADGDAAVAAARLGEALALWRGPALADLPDRDASAVRAETLRLEALRLRLTAEVALGDAARVLPEVAALAAEHPLNEPVQILRLRALRDVGRVADALSVYESVRRDLADRLGADPGPDLRALHLELLRQRPGAPARKGRPTGSLKARLTSFVGREEDLGTLRVDLTSGRLVTLTGPGGTGKTRLAVEAAERVGDSWPDGVRIAELAPVSDPRHVPEVLLTALGLRGTNLRPGAAGQGLTESRREDPVQHLIDHCAGRRILLVLDNCEHLIGTCADLVERLLTDCPGVTVLATSREPLGVPGELVRVLGPLSGPVAMRLLADRGAAARPGFTPEDDPAACQELCRRLDGLPLAIELAAARLRSLSPHQLTERLDDRFRLLTSGPSTGLPRQRTLRAVVDWSWGLLTDPERAVLRRLAVFSGGADPAAAEAVCRDTVTVDPRDVVPILGSLVDKSLVLADFTADGARYLMLETITEYAAEQLDAAGERAEAERRHLVHFREYIRTADPELRGPDQSRRLELIEREHENILTALRHAVEAGDEQEALQLVLSCDWFWTLRNYRAEARGWSAAVAALGPDPFGEPPAPVVPLERGPLDRPPPMPPEQLDEARRWVRLSEAADWQATMEELSASGARERGRAVIDAYPPHFPQSSTRMGLTRSFGVFLTGEFDDIARLVDEGVESCRRHGRVWELAYALRTRAMVLHDIPGYLPRALADITESRELFAGVGDHWGRVEVLVAEVAATADQGDWERAAECCRQGLELAREAGTHQQIPVFTVRLGDSLANTGDEEEGIRLIKEGVADADRFGPAADAAAFYGTVTLAMHYGRTGRPAKAREYVDEVMARPASRVPVFLVGILRGIRGWLTALSGDPVEGLRELRDGIESLYGNRLTELVAPHIGVLLTPSIVSVLALVAALPGVGRPGECGRSAVLMLGAHSRLRTTAVPPSEGEEITRTVTALRGLLGDRTFDALYAEGEGLTAEGAAALLRGTR